MIISVIAKKKTINTGTNPDETAGTTTGETAGTTEMIGEMTDATTGKTGLEEADLAKTAEST